MVKNQKLKNNTITKLYKILDYNSKKDLSPENGKYLVSLSQRLKETSGEEIIYKKIISKESLEGRIDPLKPKMVIHSRKVEKKIEFPEVKIEEEKKIDYRDEEIFEIEKVKVKGPEFIEVKPKVIAKEEISEKREIKKEEEEIPEWLPVETQKKEEPLEELPELEPIHQVEDKKPDMEPITQVKVKKEKKKEFEVKIEFCPECGTKLDIVTDFCPECGTEIKFEPTTSFISIKKVEEEYKPLEWEAIEIEKPKEEKIPLIEKEIKIVAFKDMKSIDEEIAVLLYDNGITTIDTLKEISLKDLTKIKGIKKKIAKDIKKEVKKKSSESIKEEPIKIEESAKDEVREDQLPIDVKIEDKIEEWPSAEELTSKTSVWEPTEEELKEKEAEEEIPIFEEFITEKEKEKPVIDKDIKIEVFKNIECIDSETAVLLYDKGYTTIYALKKAPLKDLTKLKGIRRKTAKNIKKELEVTKPKPIVIPVEEVEEKTKTDDILKIEEELDTTKQELEKITKESDTKEKNIQQLQKEIEDKTKNLESRNNELNKKDEEIKQLQDESEQKGEELETRNLELNKKQEEIEKIKTDLQTKTEELDKKQQTITELQTELTEKQKELETKEKETKIKIFKDIKSIDDKTAILLYDNGITTIDALTTTSQKDLTTIKGIKTKTAKKIKKEQETITQELNKKEKNIQQLQKEIEDKTKNLESRNNELNKKDEEIKQLQDESEQKGEELETRNLELNKKQEEIEKIKTDLQTKTEELDKKQQTITELQTELTEKQKELETKEKETKIKIFKDIKSIDDKTAILLYDNGITTIDALTTTSQKDLTTIKGIKTKTAKKIKKELEHKSDKESIKVIKTENEERSAEYFADEKEITRDEASEIDKKIVEELSILVIDDDVFKDINSIDEKISKLLEEKGIDSLDALRKATIKDLTKIKGIKRKVAKQIKKEISNLPEESVDVLSESSFEQEKPSIKKEEDEWESYDEDKISYSTMREIKGFRHGDYSLYKKEIETKSGKKRIVRFFSKAEPDDGKPIELPKGYQVKKNKKTGLPYLKRKK